MRFNFLPFLLLTIICYSCSNINAQKENTQKKIISCIQQKIEAYKKQPITNPPMVVYRYNYNNETVYFIAVPCCDRYSTLYNANCEIICRPSGGITGSGDGKCSDFFEKRTDEKLIWKDDRKSK